MGAPRLLQSGSPKRIPGEALGVERILRGVFHLLTHDD